VSKVYKCIHPSFSYVSFHFKFILSLPLDRISSFMHSATSTSQILHSFSLSSDFCCHWVPHIFSPKLHLDGICLIVLLLFDPFLPLYSVDSSVVSQNSVVIMCYFNVVTNMFCASLLLFYSGLVLT